MEADRTTPATFDGFYAEQATFLHDVDFSQCRFVGDVTFEQATFCASVTFEEALFEDAARFAQARFSGYATFQGAQFSTDVRFSGATFASSAIFERAVFVQSMWFERVTCEGRLDFGRTEFRTLAWFDRTSFAGRVTFERANFRGDTSFEGSHFGQVANFIQCKFSGLAMFGRAIFDSEVSFNHSVFATEVRFWHVGFNSQADFESIHFAGPVLLENAVARGQVRFDRARFADQVYAADAVFDDGLWFSRAEFTLASDIGPFAVGDILVVDQATFGRRLRLRVRASRVSAIDARFIDGVNLQAENAELVLEGAVFGGPSTIIGARGDDLGARTRLLTLRRVDVSNITIVQVDLGACLFEGVHSLDRVRIEGSGSFVSSPSPQERRIGSHRIPLGRRWTKRQTLAEEHHWRATVHATGPSSSDGHHWKSEKTHTPSWVSERTGHQPSIISPDRIVPLYRALRKATEDAKNEPGAADFYYGEMEMRRHSEAISFTERLILHAYWIISGYGLRAWRAITLLFVDVITHGMLFALFGFPASFKAAVGLVPWRGQLYALSVLFLTPIPSIPLTMPGQVIRISLRITGPVLLGLALLAVRNRVKR